jgi:inhibitor of cysteine peptidase
MNNITPDENKSRGASPQKQVSIEIPFEALAKDKHLKRVADAGVGDTIVVTLGTNPTTGFTWPDIARIGSKEILQQTDHKLIILRQANNVGAPGKDVWTFKANQKGTTTISLDYSRPWERGEKSEWTFEVTVRVK